MKTFDSYLLNSYLIILLNIQLNWFSDYGGRQREQIERERASIRGGAGERGDMQS